MMMMMMIKNKAWLATCLLVMLALSTMTSTASAASSDSSSSSSSGSGEKSFTSEAEQSLTDDDLPMPHNVVHKVKHPRDRPTPPWSYVQHGEDWSAGECGTELHQSPIDIANNTKGGADSLQLNTHYPILQAWDCGMKMVHTGARLEVKGQFGYIDHAGWSYAVKRLEFHAPSEHTIDGRHFDMEMQIVHQKRGSKGNDDLIVISVFYDARGEADHPFLKMLNWEHLPSEMGERTLLSSPITLRLASAGLHRGYYEYTGSMTSPPCTSKVQWFILETVEHMSEFQAANIAEVFQKNIGFAQGNGNNRACRPLNDRKVTLHNHRAAIDAGGVGISTNRELAPEERDLSGGDDINQASSFGSSSGKKAPLGAAPMENPEDALRRDQVVIGGSNKTATGRDVRTPGLYAQGGADWLDLCKTGRQQSPINIVVGAGNPHGDYEMEVKYTNVSNAKMVNTGATMSLRGNFGKLYVKRLGGPSPVVYYAKRITFHSPSEHVVDGRRSALEMKIVHQKPLATGDNGIAILSVLFHESATLIPGDKAARFLASLEWNSLPRKAGQSRNVSDVDLSTLNGLNGGYYSYAGSLSTPPCTEGVKRFVLRTYQEMTSVQVKTFRDLYYKNNRNVQPTNGRGVVVHRANDAADIDPNHRPPVGIFGPIGNGKAMQGNI